LSEEPPVASVCFRFSIVWRTCSSNGWSAIDGSGVPAARAAAMRRANSGDVPKWPDTKRSGPKRTAGEYGAPVGARPTGVGWSGGITRRYTGSFV